MYLTQCAHGNTIQFELEFGNVGFLREGAGKPEYLEKNISEQG